METILSHLKLKPKDLSDTHIYLVTNISTLSGNQPSGLEPQIVPEWDNSLLDEAASGSQL